MRFSESISGRLKSPRSQTAEFVWLTKVKDFSVLQNLLCFLSLLCVTFRRTLFKPRVRVLPPPDLNDGTTLSTTNRNLNICTVFPSLRFSLPSTFTCNSPLLHHSTQRPFSLDVAMARAARDIPVKPPDLPGDSQTTNIWTD